MTFNDLLVVSVRHKVKYSLCASSIFCTLQKYDFSDFLKKSCQIEFSGSYQVGHAGFLSEEFSILGKNSSVRLHYGENLHLWISGLCDFRLRMLAIVYRIYGSPCLSHHK